MIEPVAAVSASGAVTYRITNQTPAKTGTFTPSADGFETEFSRYYKIYRWIDKVNNLRLEAQQHSLGGWAVTLYDDSRTELGYYPLGYGEGFGYGLAGFSEDQIAVTTQRGAISDKSISVVFTPKSNDARAQNLSGTLTGSASQFIWSQTELPRSSRGTVTWSGKSHDVVSTTVEDVKGSVIPSITAYLSDGSSFSAYPSFGSPAQIVKTTQPGQDFECGPILGGTCDYFYAKTGTWSSSFNFSTVLYQGTSRTHSPSTRFEGSVSVGQQYSTLTVNGSPFEIKSGNFGVAVVSPVSSVADTTRFSFHPSKSGVASVIHVWRRGDKIVQVHIPSANGSDFICTENLSDSRFNVVTMHNPPFTIPACPAVTALIPLGDNVRGFEFKDFKLNAAPSNFVVPTPTVVLNGILMAKGL